MSEFNVPYSRASLTTIDITAAELEGANRGQRPDLIASEYTYRVMPGGVLYQSNGTILEDATLVVTYKNGVMQAGGTNVTPGVTPIAPLAFTSRAVVANDDRGVFICASPQVATVNTGLPTGFGCAFKGTLTTDGTATVTDVRSTGSANPWCSLVQTATNSYDLVGTKD